MKITRFEQSGLLIDSRGYQIAIDIGSTTHSASLEPYSGIDAFIVSHIHSDHFDPQNIDVMKPKKVYLNQECFKDLPNGSQLNVELIKPGWNAELGNLSVAAYEANHGPNAGTVIDNMCFVIEAEGKKLFFAGDMYYPSGPEASELEVDIAFIPIDGYYTFSPQAAIDYTQTFKDIKLLVPIHYHVRPPAIDEFMPIALEQLNLKVKDLKTLETIEV